MDNVRIQKFKLPLIDVKKLVKIYPSGSIKILGLCVRSDLTGGYKENMTAGLHQFLHP